MHIYYAMKVILQLTLHELYAHSVTIHYTILIVCPCYFASLNISSLHGMYACKIMLY